MTDNSRTYPRFLLQASHGEDVASVPPKSVLDLSPMRTCAHPIADNDLDERIAGDSNEAGSP